jgi:TonB family protein
MTAIRRSLQDTLIGARASRMAELTRSFAAALSTNRLVQPAGDNAKVHLLALIDTDATSPAVSSARQGLGAALLGEARGALARGDFGSVDAWLNETRAIGFHSEEIAALGKQAADAREAAAPQRSVVGANSLQRLEYVAPRFPAGARNRGITGWVELEFTVRADGSTGDIVVTNSTPRRTFDNAAALAVAQWRFKPATRDGNAVEQRAAVRIRFTEE